MNVEEIREYCLSLEGTTESFPFDDVTLVFKVSGKMYALLALDSPLSVNVKCDPNKAIELREVYPCVKAGYHMNKKHWNTIDIDGSVPFPFIKDWILDSYNLIINSLPKSQKEKYQNKN